MGLPISDMERERLREALPEVLAKLYGVTDLRRLFRCPNPRHEDRHPSASYDNRRHVVHCFSCGGTWDVFDLIGLHDGVEGFVAQARCVADLVGKPLTGDDDMKHPRYRKATVSRLTPSDTPNIYDACRAAYLDLRAEIGKGARDFLLARGFDDDDMAKRGLGFTTKPSSIMCQFAVHEPEAHGFIVIPYFDKNRKSVHYATLRTIEGPAPCIHKEWRPRGISVPLWQEWLLSDSLPVVYVTEGVFDAIAFEKMTGKPCVALGGTAFAGKLSDVLTNIEPGARPEKVMLLMDNDEAGSRAADGISATLDELGIPHASATDVLGTCKDVNDLLISLRGDVWGFDETTGSLESGMPIILTRWI